MFQKTIKRRVEIVGIGLHKGVPVKMVLEPLDADMGIVFHRSDMGVSIPLRPDSVTSTQLATTIEKEGASISTIEHLLSAVYAYGVDNLFISVDNSEIPIMDGSSNSFCMLLEEAGIEALNRSKKVLRIKKEVEVTQEQKFVRLKPANTTGYEFKIHFDHPLIKTQSYSLNFSTKAYKEEIAKARTFGFVHELQYLQSKNLALGASLNNAIGLDDKKILNPEGLRFKDEFVRHKILDAIGDLSLLGMPILGQYESFAGSHHLNHLLTKELLKNPDNYEIIELKEKPELTKTLSYAQASS